MTVGNIVVIKGLNLMGEVLEIDDYDMATLSLCENGTHIKVAISDLEVTGAVQPHRESGKSVSILGTQYKIVIIPEGDYRYKRDADGWCDNSSKELLLFNFTQDINSKKDLAEYQKKVLRQEIIHAFLFESGLSINSNGSNSWATNEEMVDWMAIQEPKLHKAFKEAGCNEDIM